MDGQVHRALCRRPESPAPHPEVAEGRVSEDGEWAKTEVGTPQGAVVSPLLANIYLHYVFDLWVRHWRKHHATGDVIVSGTLMIVRHDGAERRP